MHRMDSGVSMHYKVMDAEGGIVAPNAWNEEVLTVHHQTLTGLRANGFTGNPKENSILSSNDLKKKGFRLPGTPNEWDDGVSGRVLTTEAVLHPKAQVPAELFDMVKGELQRQGFSQQVAHVARVQDKPKPLDMRAVRTAIFQEVAKMYGETDDSRKVVDSIMTKLGRMLGQGRSQ